MGAVKDTFFDELASVGEYLTENNAHFARLMLDYSTGGNTRPYADEELELVYRVGVQILCELNSANRMNWTPDFSSAISYLQEYAKTIGATAPSERGN